MTAWARGLGIALGAVYAVDCVVETWAHRDDGVAFWFLTTSTASVLVLAGSLVRWHEPFVGAALVAVGGAVGMVPTAWTVLVPLFAFAVITVTLIDAARRHDALHA